MPSAAHLRLQIETALADRIPSALTPAPRVIRPTAPTGIAALDAALGGGLPLGAISELAGPECSGRTSLALSFVAGRTRAGQVCAWVDVSDTLHPESAAAAGVDLGRLLWIRCGPEAEQLALPGLSDPPGSAKKPSGTAPPAVLPRSGPSQSAETFTPRCAEPVPKVRHSSREAVPLQPATCNLAPVPRPARKPWSRMDQALRAADLLLNAGGFAAIVLDMGSVAPEFALRVPLVTWFRYRAVAERSQAGVLLLTQQACTKSSAGLVLHCEAGPVALDSTTVLTGAESLVTITRERFANVSDFTRKPPRSDLSGLDSGSALRWQTQTPWAGIHAAPPAKAGRQ